MRQHSQPLSGDETGAAMSNVAKLQKALEAAENMTETEYRILYESAKQADDNLVSIENYDEIISRHQEFKKMLMHMKCGPTI